MMVTASGRRRFKNIVLTFMVLILSVQFVVFITTTFHSHRHIFVYESGVCKCQARALGDFRDTDINSRIQEMDAATVSAQETSENIDIRKENTAKTISEVSTSVALNSSINLRRPITVRSTVKITSIKSNPIISKTNGNPLISEAGHTNTNKAQSMVKYLPTIKSGEAEITVQNSQTAQARSKERNNVQPNTREQKEKPPPKLLPNETPVLSNGLKVVKQATTKVLRSTPTDKRAPLTKVSRVQLPIVKELQPQPSHKTLRTVKTPTISHKIPSTFKRMQKLTPTMGKNVLHTAVKKLPSSSIKKVPPSYLKTVKVPKAKAPLPTSRKVPLQPKLATNKTLSTVNKQLPTTKKIPMPTIKKVPSAMKIKQRTVKASSPIFQKVPPAKKSTVNEAAPTAKKLLPAARKSQISSIKKVPSSVLTDRKASKNKVPQLNSKKVPPVTPKLAQVPPRISRKTPLPVKRQIAKQTRNNIMKNKPENKITTASTSDFTWKTLTNNLSIFSSYFDSRYLKTKEGLFQYSVVIIGYELGIFSNRDLFCVAIMQNDERWMLQEPAVRILLAESWKKMHTKYRAVMYRCNLTIAKAPRYITLIDTGTYTELQSIPKAIFIPVVDPHFPGLTHEFGVCYETPLYGNKYDQGIMDSIEMNKLLGATWFTIYVYEANDKALEILRYYSQELKTLDALLNWGVNMPTPVYNRGLLAGVHDCFYRNMYRVRYLVLCDLDEVIMPVKSLNWHELLLKIDKPKLAYFVFRHLGFHKNVTKPTELLHCPGQSNLTYKLPRFFATHNRSVSVISRSRQSKSIAKPRYSTVVHVHYFRAILPGYKAYFVPTDVALMKHFRDKDDPRYKNYTSILDFSMDRFKPVILAAIEKHYCRNIKHVSR